MKYSMTTVHVHGLDTVVWFDSIMASTGLLMASLLHAMQGGPVRFLCSARSHNAANVTRRQLHSKREYLQSFSAVGIGQHSDTCDNGVL